MLRMTIVLFLLFACVPVFAADGKSVMTVDSWAGSPLRVFITEPPSLEPESPVIIVMHGVRRNADEYRDQWHDLALKHGFLLVVPEFPKALFPGSLAYNSGNVIEESGVPVPREQWAFSAIEAVFDAVREHFGMSTERYSLYGHSAGSQFVHRFLMHMPEARVEQIVAANAGWYTMPDFDVAFPYGLKASAVSKADLAHALQQSVTILLGEQDTDVNHDNLRRTPEADRQGPHRYARGLNFFETSSRVAAELGVPFKWQLERVGGAHHDNRLMAPVAVRFLLSDVTGSKD